MNTLLILKSSKEVFKEYFFSVIPFFILISFLAVNLNFHILINCSFILDKVSSLSFITI